MQHLQEIGTQHSYALPSMPPVSSQQSFSKPPIVGQQNLSGSQMQPHLLPMQSVDHAQITNPAVTGAPGSHMSPPHLLAGLHGQSSVSYQTQMTNSSSTSLPQSGVGSYNCAPPLPTQAVTSPTSPGLLQLESRQYVPPHSTTGQYVPTHSTTGQHVPPHSTTGQYVPPHSTTGQYVPPYSTTGQHVPSHSTMGQPITSPPGSGFPQIRQKQYLQTAPPMSGQTIASPAGPGLPQPGQRQYGSAPPLPGQALSSPLGTRTSPGITADYQQPTYQQPGYHNQTVRICVRNFLYVKIVNYMRKTVLTIVLFSQEMYNSQRNSYQSNIPNTTGYQSGVPPQQPRRLDPEQMPSPVRVYFLHISFICHSNHLLF